MTTREEARSGAHPSEHEAAQQGDQTAGQESYPGPRRQDQRSGQGAQNSPAGGDATTDSRATGGNREPGNETGRNGDTPEAGDVDASATRSAEETGQDGDPGEAKKSTAHPWNG